MCVPPVIAPGAPRPPRDAHTSGPGPLQECSMSPVGRHVARMPGPARPAGAWPPPAPGSLGGLQPLPCCSGSQLPAVRAFLVPYPSVPGTLPILPPSRPPHPAVPRGLGLEPASQSVVRALPRAAPSTLARTGSPGGGGETGRTSAGPGNGGQACHQGLGMAGVVTFHSPPGGLSGGPRSTLAKPAFRGAGTRSGWGHLD